MKNPVFALLLVTVFGFFAEAGQIGWQSSFQGKVKLENGGMKGELQVGLPEMFARGLDQADVRVHSFLSLQALAFEQVKILHYVCIDGEMVLFKNHHQGLKQDSLDVQSFLASGQAARNLMMSQFGWLLEESASLGPSGLPLERLVCEQSFVESRQGLSLPTLSGREFKSQNGTHFKFDLRKRGFVRSREILVIDFESR
jgi:hypothetical protein